MAICAQCPPALVYLAGRKPTTKSTSICAAASGESSLRSLIKAASSLRLRGGQLGLDTSNFVFHRLVAVNPCSYFDNCGNPGSTAFVDYLMTAFDGRKNSI